MEYGEQMELYRSMLLWCPVGYRLAAAWIEFGGVKDRPHQAQFDSPLWIHQ